MFRGEGTQQIGNQVKARADRVAQLDPARSTAFGNARHRCLEVPYRAPRQACEDRAGVRQRHAARRTREELHAQRPFQVPDRLAQPRRRDVQALRRSTEVLLLGHGQKRLNLPKRDHHRTPPIGRTITPILACWGTAARAHHPT